MTELLLIRPGIAKKTDKRWSVVPPLGIGYLAAVARKNGIGVQVIDSKQMGHTSIDMTIDEIIKIKPKFIGISALTEEYPQAKSIACKAKEFVDKPITILGGAHANALPIETIKESPEFDYVFAGDGELLFNRENLACLEEQREINDIPGLFGRTGDFSPNRNQTPVYKSELADGIFPAWDLFPKAKIYPILTERGCPFKCVFCSRNSSFKIRKRPIKSVIEEIEWLDHEFQPEQIHFEDETFGLNKQRIISLLEWLIEYNRKSRITFKAQTRVDKISYDMLILMKRAGFEFVEYGVESGDPEVLRQSGKMICREQVSNAVELAKKAGIKVWLKFIIGLPGESRNSIRNTIDFAVKLNPHRLSVAVIVAYPGCDIYRWALAGKKGYRFTSREWNKFDKYFSNSIELDGLPAKLMRRYQIQMYLETYMRNYRFLDLIKMVKNNSYIIKPVLLNLLKR